ncbi:1-phosphofructokinase family hexose kinase [Brevibacterium atlanticum]|uniref:1-phosphofructokinase family hexose kinase n=1 Tax=Brevibacterium atlanticum TaxID=2697563 RepID=UPI00141F8085|nr:1-phosphofructokinase family hexose kinase [Brevibacterium atlanticum]
MILTLTANPSLDRTIELAGPVLRGQVQRAVWAGQQPGGKGVNVSRAVASAGRSTRAVLPGDAGDPVLSGLDAIGLAHDSVPTGAPIRSNITVTEPDGTTTKINEPGSCLSPETQTELLDLVAALATDADWVVLAGSLPPGVDDDFYARAIAVIRTLPQPPSIAVDTSGAPLAAALKQSPDLIKPNAEELAELLGAAGLLGETGADDVGLHDSRLADSARSDAEAVEGTFGHPDRGTATQLATGELHAIAARLEASPELTAQATRALLDSAAPGPRSILATLGAGGAVLAARDAAWHAVHPPMEVVSTVGAGDSTLAGYLLGRTEGEEPQIALARAVAYGTAAATLRGTGVPTPDLIDLGTVTVTPLSNTTPTPTTDQPKQHAGTAPEAEEA